VLFRDPGKLDERKETTTERRKIKNVIIKCDQILFSMSQQTIVGQDLLIIETSRTHSDTPHSVGILWMGDRLDTETST
jgi:hypothetical protein